MTPWRSRLQLDGTRPGRSGEEDAGMLRRRLIFGLNTPMPRSSDVPPVCARPFPVCQTCLQGPGLFSTDCQTGADGQRHMAICCEWISITPISARRAEPRLRCART